MNSTILQADIVENRKNRATRLVALAKATGKMREALRLVHGSTLRFSKPKTLQALMADLQSYHERVERKRRLFESGMVTICIAGLEKSGKSTMLKALTGIELPVASARCTSVPCDILYSEHDTPSFDILYYTEDELYKVVAAIWLYLHDARTDAWQGGNLDLAKDTPGSLSAFCHCNLPEPAALLDELKYADALRQLRAIQAGLKNAAFKLGTVEEGKGLGELSRYVRHEEGSTEAQCLIKKVLIHSKFENGCDTLRLCDTPGVDDPNPNARELTERAIREEADLLVLAHRPKDSPSLTNSLTNFISDLRHTDQDAPLRRRTVYFVNWYKPADTDGSLAGEHIRYVTEKNVFEKIYGPCDVTEPGAVSSFLQEMNAFIADRLPQMDEEVINKFENEYRSLQSRVRIEVYDPLVSQAPPLPENAEQMLNNCYQDWFDDFYDDLVSGFNTLSQQESIPELDKVHEDIAGTVQGAQRELHDWVQANAGIAVCKREIGHGDNPGVVLLPQLASIMTEIVERLTIAIETLCPAIQTEVLKVITRALGESVTSRLLSGDKDKARLTSLMDILKASADNQQQDPNITFIVKGLQEYADLHAQMGYIMRHELRPCLNLFDPLRWSSARITRMKERASAVLKDDSCAKCKAWLATAKLPTYSDSPQEHAKFIEQVTFTAYLMLKGVMDTRHSQLREMVDDFLSQASQRLGTQDLCRRGWYRALAPRKRDILAETAQAYTAQAEEAKAFDDLQQTLLASLS